MYFSAMYRLCLYCKARWRQTKVGCEKQAILKINVSISQKLQQIRMSKVTIDD